MKKILLFCIWIFTSILSYSQKKMPLFIDSLFIYKGLFTGGTTNVLSLRSAQADTMHGIAKIKVQLADLDTLNLLLKSITSKRHFQQKIGPVHYALAYINGESHRLSVIKSFGFIDMSLRREYGFRDTAYCGIFNRFVERNY